jgi:hypothetical protein
MTALCRTNSCCYSSHLAARFSVLLLFFALLVPAGCKKNSEVDDPQLKPIQEMLEQNIPAGSTESTVNYFLDVRGYPREAAAKKGTLVAIIRHIDTEKLQPVTARVTFYFDANGKLNTTEIVRTFNQPIPQ